MSGTLLTTSNTANKPSATPANKPSATPSNAWEEESAVFDVVGRRGGLERAFIHVTEGDFWSGLQPLLEDYDYDSDEDEDDRSKWILLRFPGTLARGQWIHQQHYEKYSPWCYKFFKAVNEYNRRKISQWGKETFETMDWDDFNLLWGTQEPGSEAIRENYNENVMLALAQFPAGGRYVLMHDLHTIIDCADEEKNLVFAGLRREVYDRWHYSASMNEACLWDDDDWIPDTTFSYEKHEEFIPLWNQLKAIPHPLN